MDSGLFGFWLRFGSVTGFFKPAPSPKPRQNPKILAAHRYIFSVNAPVPNMTFGRFRAAPQILKVTAATICVRCLSPNSGDHEKLDKRLVFVRIRSFRMKLNSALRCLVVLAGLAISISYAVGAIPT